LTNFIVIAQVPFWVRTAAWLARIEARRRRPSITSLVPLSKQDIHLFGRFHEASIVNQHIANPTFSIAYARYRIFLQNINLTSFQIY
jgi:hypothetical protein